MQRLAAFAELVGAGEESLDLARACLMIAEDVYPGLDVEAYVSAIEGMAERLRGALPPHAGAEDKVMGLNRLLFEELGYRGNTEDYYDPRNSYLNEVLERRTGIPITLSVLYLEIARRVGLSLEGVSFPGHFLVRLRLGPGILVLDPFSGGTPLGEQELRERLARVIPEGVAPESAVADLPLDQFLEPASRRQILARVLRNLKGIYREADRPERMLEVLNRVLLVSPHAWSELRDRGYVYRRLECHRAALNDLSEYLARDPDADDAEDARADVIELSRRCARLN